ncbi:MAG: putative peroxiredoxin bcp [Promethearchaeota archaeon]|nr:MAG: putative peroxiredoxin bcp [Candidatus Lokiarchaeota archaeon]
MSVRERKYLEVGEEAPDFCLPDQANHEVCLHDFKGKYVVLYFIPKEQSPGCATEGIAFTKLLTEFEDLNTFVVGISPEDPLILSKMKREYNLNIIMLSDRDQEVINKYGAWAQKEFCGEQIKGIIRTTYIIDPEGKIGFVWPRVVPEGHANEVKEKIEKIREGKV